MINRPHVDLRDEIFVNIADKNIIACIITDQDGIIAETDAAAEEAERLGLFVGMMLKNGMRIHKGATVARFRGHPKQIAMAEEVLIGIMAKPSGIATAMREFIEKAEGRPQIVCGAWKKMPPPLKELIRRSVVAGGGSFRITSEPFVYLDKTYIEMFGSISGCLDAVSGLSELAKVVQLKGRYHDIADEAREAVQHGAAILFIDTGKKSDLKRVIDTLRDLRLRDRVRIAFGGNIRLADIESLKSMDVDILDVGRAIVDAPLLDMRLEIEDISDY